MRKASSFKYKQNVKGNARKKHQQPDAFPYRVRSRAKHAAAADCLHVPVTRSLPVPTLTSCSSAVNSGLPSSERI